MPSALSTAHSASYCTQAPCPARSVHRGMFSIWMSTIYRGRRRFASGHQITISAPISTYTTPPATIRAPYTGLISAACRHGTTSSVSQGHCKRPKFDAFARSSLTKTLTEQYGPGGTDAHAMAKPKNSDGPIRSHTKTCQSHN